MQPITPPLPPYLENTVLLVDKPLGWTSFDAVNKIRNDIKHHLGIRKIKIGHAGTLDPLATGLLIICIGKATKRIEEYQNQPKEYTGTITLGATTPCYDLEKPIDAHFPTDHITGELLEKARSGFLGQIEQAPPIFSAIKVEGKTAYRLARKGREIKIEPRKITIYEFELTEVAMPVLHFRVRCSKGTYIRSLANDFGKAVGSGAHLSSLRRTAIGEFRVEDAVDARGALELLLGQASK